MAKIIGPELKNMPWEDRPEGHFMPVWRYSGNPIIGLIGCAVCGFSVGIFWPDLSFFVFLILSKCGQRVIMTNKIIQLSES